VIGHDHRSGEVRTFAVDRIQEASVTGTSFSIPEDFDFEARTASAFGVVAEPAETVRIRFDRRWALYVREHEWHPSQQIEAHDDGAIELCMEVGAGEELQGWLLSFGGGAEVLEPKRLRAVVAAELGRMQARYADVGGR
jgi:predicted DNA-binding transcriptional regulator YafY